MPKPSGNPYETNWLAEQIDEFQAIAALACELRRYEKRGDEIEAKRIRSLLDAKIAATPYKNSLPSAA